MFSSRKGASCCCFCAWPCNTPNVRVTDSADSLQVLTHILHRDDKFRVMRTLLAFTLALTMTASVTASAQQKPLPEGYWPEAQSNTILEKTETIRLAPDLSSLTAEEQAALKDLLEVGAIMQKLYEISAASRGRARAIDRLRVLDVSSAAESDAEPAAALSPLPGTDRHDARQQTRSRSSRSRRRRRAATSIRSTPRARRSTPSSPRTRRARRHPRPSAPSSAARPRTTSSRTSAR
jgi:hypothetical protein